MSSPRKGRQKGLSAKHNDHCNSLLLPQLLFLVSYMYTDFGNLFTHILKKYVYLIKHRSVMCTLSYGGNQQYSKISFLYRQ